MTYFEDLTEEIYQTNVKNGWAGEGVTSPTFHEALALLLTEVAEVMEAWRRWGFKDATEHRSIAKLPKPEGVGSEFADIVIRYLDDCKLFGIPLPTGSLKDYEDRPDEGISLMVAGYRMAKGVTRIGDSWDVHGSVTRFVGDQFAAFWLLVMDYAEVFGVNLDFEVHRKMEFNKTRSHRHGGKRL